MCRSTLGQPVMHRPGPYACPAPLPPPPPEPGSFLWAAGVRTGAMGDLPPLTASVDWSAGVATVAVHGDLDSAACAQLRERLAWVMDSCPQHLVLEVGGVPDRCCEQVI